MLVGDDVRIGALKCLGVCHVNLAGRTLIPGYNDAHVHVSLLTSLVDTRIHVAPNILAIIERLCARAVAAPSSWVEGVGYNEVQLPEGRHLTCHDLDHASARHQGVAARSRRMACRWRRCVAYDILMGANCRLPTAGAAL